MEKSDVIDMINSTFKGIALPSEDYVNSKYPGIIQHPSNQDTRTTLSGKHWKDLTPAIVGHIGSDLGGLCPEEMRFYLPGYMILCINSFLDIQLGMNTVLDILTLKDEHPFHVKYFHELVDDLTIEQKKTVRFFLEYLRDNIYTKFPDEFYVEINPNVALERYWNKF